MSDEKKNPNLQLQPGDVGGEETDVIFRTQMAIANFVLGHWRTALGLVAIGLIALLGYSSWKNWVMEQQREQQASIARIDRKMPEPDQLARMGMGPLDDPNDTARTAKLVEAAQGYEEIGRTGSGTAGAMAWVRAALVWERAGRTEDATRAWQAAYDMGGPGPIGLAATTGLASKKAEAGDIDGAAAMLRAAASAGDGFESQWALYQLALLYEGHDRKDDAGKALEEFSTRFPTSTIADQAAAAAARVRGAG